MIRSSGNCQMPNNDIHKQLPLPNLGNDVEQSYLLSLFADQLSSQLSSMERNVSKAQDLHQRVLVRISYHYVWP